ncbi:MAG TPA: bifunctional YncE family protein/alkaline phosphatase family protein [Gemmatimonadaceae bacterium]
MGVRLDPAAPLATVGQMPLTMRVAPEGDRVVLSLSGYRQQGIEVVDATSGRVLQDLPQASAFIGLAFSPDGHALYSSGANSDVVYRYRWEGGRATLDDSLVLARKAPRATGTRYPSGLALSPDGKTLYVAENLADSLAVIDVANREVIQRLPVGRYPYDVVVDKNGVVYVSAWGANTVSVFHQEMNGWLGATSQMTVARHPSALLLNPDGTRLFVASGSTDHVAVVDTKTQRVIARLLDPPPAGPNEGATPNALALSPDGTRLFVAEGDANAVGIFNLSATTANVAAAHGDDRLAGRIPSGWYPSSLAQVGDGLIVASGKGKGSVANPRGPNPRIGRNDQYSLSLLNGGMMRIPLSQTEGEALTRFSARVATANGWNDASRQHRYPPFEHVIYIIKENRTYDQVLGDDKRGDGDPSLVFFPRTISVNHHALADRFGLFDRFFVNAEVSPDGHNWSTAAYATDYLEKTVPSHYSMRGRSYDYEGLNRGVGMRHIPEDDVAEPASGYLWNLAEKKGITFRNYGEFVVPTGPRSPDSLPPGYRGNKPFLRTHTNPLYPGFELTIKDQHRADVWIAEFEQFVQSGNLPALEIIRLPNDHTSYALAGRPSPRAAFADNDLALGRIIEALSTSPFWKNTVVFVLEDDAQNGADHVDSHRSPMFVISAYSRPGVVHRFTNTTDVLRTIEEILGLQSMSQYDYFGRPLRDIWADSPDLRPYVALTPAQSLDERNPGGTEGARDSEKLDLSIEDAADEALSNRILWQTIKGRDVPYPAPHRASAQVLKIGG